MSETGPETGEGTAPEPPTGRIGWRRLILLGLLAGGAVMVTTHAVGGRDSLYIGLAAAAVILLGVFLWRFPHIMRHFHPFGRRNRSSFRRSTRTRTGFRSPGMPRRSGGRGGGRSPFRTSGNSGRRSRSSMMSPGTGRRRGGTGLTRPRKGSSGLGRGSGAGSRRGRGLSPGSRRGSGTFRRSRGTSGRSGGLSRRRGGSGGPGAGILRGRRRLRPGTGSGGGPRARTGRRGAGRRPSSPRPVPAPRRRVTRPRTWFRRRSGGAPAPRSPRRRGRGIPIGFGWRLHTPSARRLSRRWRAWRHGSGTGSRRWFAPFRGRRGPVLRTARRYRTWRAQRPARQARRNAHKARMQGWKRKQARINPKPWHWYMPWRRKGVIPVWRVRQRHRRMTLRARIARRWRIRRGVHTGLGLVSRRPRVRLRAVRRALNPRRAWLRLRRWRNRTTGRPALWAPRGHRYQRQVARFDAWRRARHERRRSRFRAATAALARTEAPRPRPARSTRTPAQAAAVPLPGRRTSSPLSGRSTGGSGMATSAQVAEGIRDLNVDWDDAEELHQILMHLHEIIEATQERLQRVGDKLSDTALKSKYADAVSEAAGSLSGSADSLQSVVGGGVLRG